jgi:hypothetical protein
VAGESLLNWTRKQTDKDPKHYKEWRAGRNRYRIVWRDRVYEVSVTPGYQCGVRVWVPDTNRNIWDFVDQKRRTPYRTFKAAKDACERHADPSYKPERKKKKKPKAKRKAPMRICPECEIKIHVRKALCYCGYKFPKKVKQ